jgi:hypothetical protein
MNVVRVVRLAELPSGVEASRRVRCSRWVPGSDPSRSLCVDSAMTSPSATDTPTTAMRSTSTSGSWSRRGPNRLDDPEERTRGDRGSRPVRCRACRRGHRARSAHAEYLPEMLSEAIRPGSPFYSIRRTSLDTGVGEPSSGARRSFRRSRISTAVSRPGEDTIASSQLVSSCGCSGRLAAKTSKVEFLDRNMLQFEEVPARRSNASPPRGRVNV